MTSINGAFIIIITESLTFQILETEPRYYGALALGLTSCNPASLKPSDLPDDSNFLLDRPEYWVVSKDVANSPRVGDDLTFCITPRGKLSTRIDYRGLRNDRK